MSVYTVMKCLRNWTVDPAEAAIATKSTANELVERYGLTVEEANAIRDGRVDVLHAMGVHPMTLIQLSRVFGFSIGDKWESLLGQTSAGSGDDSQ